MNQAFKKDYERFCKEEYNFVKCILRMIKNHELAFLFWGRQSQFSKGLMHKFCDIVLFQYRKKYGIEMNLKNCGGGFALSTRGVLQ